MSCRLKATRTMPLTDAEVIAQRNDREMLLRPHLWPYQERSPCVYVHKDPSQKGWGHTGPVTRDEVGRYTVSDHDWTAVNAGTGNLVRMTKVYADVDALLADGWLVD